MRETYPGTAEQQESDGFSSIRAVYIRGALKGAAIGSTLVGLGELADFLNVIDFDSVAGAVGATALIAISGVVEVRKKTFNTPNEYDNVD